MAYKWVLSAIFDILTILLATSFMRYLPLLLIFLFACTTPEKENVHPEKWISIFNGKDLQDWDIKIRGHELNDNFANTFQVEDGLLKVKYEGYEKFDETFGHIFYKKPFSYYLIRAEYRFVGEQANEGPGWATRNNGLMLHSQSAASMGLEQDFPISIEVQLLGGLGTGPRPTANLCTPGTHVEMADTLFTSHCIPSVSKTYDGDQWVNMEVLVLGDSLFTHIVEGDTVMRYSKPQIGGGVVAGHDPAQKVDGKILTGGYIALQGESHPTEFRKIEVLDLGECKEHLAEVLAKVRKGEL